LAVRVLDVVAVENSRRLDVHALGPTADEEIELLPFLLGATAQLRVHFNAVAETPKQRVCVQLPPGWQVLMHIVFTEPIPQLAIDVRKSGIPLLGLASHPVPG
jgi:hypothetical protein